MKEAVAAYEEGEVPVGAVIACRGKLIAKAHNLREKLKDPTAHAEILAITQAAEHLGDWRLEDCVLYVSLEPCPMCAGAIVNSRIPKVVYAARDPKAGACTSLFTLLSDSRLNHQCEIEAGLYEENSSGILKSFFAERRKKKPRQIDESDSTIN